MKDVVMNELSWKEKIVVRAFRKTFEKVYDLTRIITVNEIIK